jgi:anaerobic magnesium-protoporphyrin IX monomethyl ester cyclase
MKVLFLQKDIYAKLAVQSLSAVLKKSGYQTDLLIDDLEKSLIDQALKIDPDIIAFSITTGEYPWMCEITDQIRDRYKKLIICGGSHPTFFQEVINDDNLDAICIGEAEEAIIDFVSTLEKGGDITSIPNFIVKKDGKIFKNDIRPLIENLDSIPFCDREIYNKYTLHKSTLNSILFHQVIFTSRGCPNKCTFCFNEKYNSIYKNKGKIVRRRSVSHVIKELKEMKQKNNFRFISFEDDAFTLPPKKWVEEFLLEYHAEINIPFKIMTRANLLDEGLIKKFKEANCFSLKIGVEVGNEQLRNSLLKKQIRDEDIINTAELCKKYGIRLQTYNIMGFPGETIDMALETYEINRRIQPDFVWCSLLNPYPGTEIYNYSKDNGFLPELYDNNEIGYSYFSETPVKMDHKREICNLQKILFVCIFLKLPRSLTKLLIKLPLGFFYRLMFGVGLFIGMIRINKNDFLSSVKIAFFNMIKYLYKG